MRWEPLSLPLIQPPSLHTPHALAGWMYAGGVPYEALDELGAHATAPSESFYSFLRRMPREQVWRAGLGVASN